MEVSEIADRLNEKADDLAPQLLPNGHRSGNYWMASGIDDTGRSTSLFVWLKGSCVGHWRDDGNAAAGEERGDMLDLVRLKQTGGDKAAAVAWAKSYLGIEDDFTPGQKPKDNPEERARREEEARKRAAKREEAAARERAEKARNARFRFLKGEPLAGTPAAFYLRNRQITPGESGEWPGSLRYHPKMLFKPLDLEVPAMLGAIYDAAGTHIGTHRTFLQLVEGEGQPGGKGWRKIDHPQAKMVLGNMGGGFIPINKGSSGKSMAKMPAGEPVYMTEGIEDALCVRMLKPEARIIAAISLGNIGAVVLPEAARELVVVADRDENPQAQDRLERSIAQQQARGLKVSLVMPPAGIKDINDWVRLPEGTTDEQLAEHERELAKHSRRQS